MRKTVILMLSALALVSCMGGGGNASESGAGADVRQPAAVKAKETGQKDPQTRNFPQVKVPSIYTDPLEIQEYALGHYWDEFFAGSGKTDANTILGVDRKAVEQQVSNYVNILTAMAGRALPEDSATLGTAQKSVDRMASLMERSQLADTSSTVYLQMTELMEKYLYDPNSPMRNEDLWLPFVKALSVSPCTADDRRSGYAYEARMCSINRFGSVAPDFKFRTLDGHSLSLHGIDAQYTMLFFSNPGCESCKEIIRDVKSRNYIDSMISDRVLAVVNVYIDEEVAKWREYAPNYPSNWYSGYDYTFSIRSDLKYNVRAIPSLYLLDREKRVLMKDAPTEKVLSFLDMTIQQNL